MIAYSLNCCPKSGVHYSFRRLSGGTLLRLKSAPKKDLDHIGKQIGVAAPSLASLRMLYQRAYRDRLFAEVCQLPVRGGPVC